MQGFKKSAGRPGEKAKKGGARVKKQIKLKQKAKVGQPLKLPTKQTQWLGHALDDKELSKAIAKHSESRVAAKLFQAGGKIGICKLPVNRRLAVACWHANPVTLSTLMTANAPSCFSHSLPSQSLSMSDQERFSFTINFLASLPSFLLLFYISFLCSYS